MKQWLRQRGVSQLELALRAEMSRRHISFIKTGRSRPGSEVVHRIAEVLEIPLRECKVMLAAAGLAPGYAGVPLPDDSLAPFRNAIQAMMRAQEPAWPTRSIAGGTWWMPTRSGA